MFEDEESEVKVNEGLRLVFGEGQTAKVLLSGEVVSVPKPVPTLELHPKNNPNPDPVVNPAAGGGPPDDVFERVRRDDRLDSDEWYTCKEHGGYFSRPQGELGQHLAAYHSGADR